MSTTSIGFARPSTPAADATRSVQPVAIAAQTQEAKTSTQTSTSPSSLPDFFCSATAESSCSRLIRPSCRNMSPNFFVCIVAPVNYRRRSPFKDGGVCC